MIEWREMPLFIWMNWMSLEVRRRLTFKGISALLGLEDLTDVVDYTGVRVASQLVDEGPINFKIGSIGSGTESDMNALEHVDNLPHVSFAE